MASSRTADADIGVEVAVGVLGLMGAVYDPWCVDKTVSVYVRMSRIAGVLILIVWALGTLAWTLIASHQLEAEERSVWTAAAVLATAATVPPIGRGAAVLFKYGNKTMDVLRHAKADEDSIEERAEPKRWFKRFIVVYWQSTWFVVGKISLRIGLTEMANQFFCEDVPANFRVLVYGTKKPEPQWTPHAWMRRFLRLVALVLDIFGVLYFVGHLASAAIEVFITLIGAVWVCLAFSWTYTRYWCKVKGDDRVVAWEHLLACKGCREGDSCADKSMECSKHRMLPSI